MVNKRPACSTALKLTSWIMNSQTRRAHALVALAELHGGVLAHFEITFEFLRILTFSSKFTIQCSFIHEL